MHHRIQATPTGKKPVAIKRDSPVAPAWPSFKGDSQFVGTSPSGRVTVFVDPALGDPGLQNAQDLVNDGDRVVTANDGIFGTTGGADHMGCDYTTGANIEACASFGNSARVSALFEAELSECSMNGNLCGLSTGEALSRWCAAVISNNALGDFATAPTWVQDGEPDFVNTTDQTDGNADSTGCGMAFISWLVSNGFGLEKIAPAMVNLGDAGTFAQLYGTLTSDDSANALQNFQNALAALPNGVTDDDPFGGLASPLQMAHLAPRTAELVGRIFASMVGDLAAGRQPEQMMANVRAAMVPAARPAAPAICSPKSKRLLPPGRGGKNQVGVNRSK